MLPPELPEHEVLRLQAASKRHLESRDEVEARLAAKLRTEAERIYAAMCRTEHHRVDVLLGALYEVVEREAQTARTEAERDAASEYQAKMDGFDAALRRLLSSWRKP